MRRKGFRRDGAAFCAVAVAFTLGVPGIAAAAKQGLIELKTIAETELVVRRADGTQETKRIQAERVVPGDEVIYTIRYQNVGKEPADAVAITNPMPEHMEFRRVLDAAPKLAELTFSIDGGATFDVPAKLVVATDKGPRPAQPEEYTHVRWTLREPVPPGGSGQVSFRARLQ
jgi:uncharacterized repeat protein (TIGR01451 family)